MISLTSTERKAVLFLLSILFLGASLRLYLAVSYHNNEKLFYGETVKEKILININTASQEELLVLPFIGEKIARRIIEYRRQKGKFSSIDDLKKVKGIGEKKLQVLKEYVTF